MEYQKNINFLDTVSDNDFPRSAPKMDSSL